ncbi:LysR family transcriptional regulator [Piscinibacter sp.]|uniref:LysR family transcriptional regulator n=1 Tax=Piscinibacter sp. TaxID=1903157 RepID=UPI001B5735A5|nr:LysR family transcriptional regulator [Piscinibacter sp.]MBP5990018.1 LysR family transcriptional regulator [Piscinibacter sp.]MBP6026597.1 LysR family transcriptional regulator [Piscinibacter sp.]
MNFRTLDLNLLRVFDTVMAEGSITRAAERLAMTQPAVSNALKRLRDSVGEDLLTRAARGVAPTAFGEALWPQVRSALGQLRAALEPGDFDPALDARVFRLTMADAMAAFLLPALMARFATLGARCQIEVRPLLDRDPRELLAHADIDVALGHFPEVLAALAAQGRVAPLRHRRLGEGRYVCVMRAGHPLAGAPLTLAAFCAAEHVLVSFSGRPHGFVDQALAAQQLSRRVALTVNQFFTAAQVVARSDLLTVLPERFLPLTGLEDRLVVRELPVEPGTVYADAIWHVRHDRSAAHQWLLAQFAEVSAAAAAAA